MRSPSQILHERRFRAQVIRILRKRYKLREDEAAQIVDQYVNKANWWYVSRMHHPAQVALAVARHAAEDEREARARERYASRRRGVAKRNTRGRFTRRR